MTAGMNRFPVTPLYTEGVESDNMCLYNYYLLEIVIISEQLYIYLQEARSDEVYCNLCREPWTTRKSDFLKK